MLDVERWEEPVALSTIVQLERNDGPLQVEVVRGAAAARTLAEQTYRIHYVAALGQTRRHLELIAATAAAATILRTRGRASIADVASAIVSA